MSLETHNFYEFGDFRLDLAEKILVRNGNFIPITPKVFETLCVLVENAGRILEKDELMQRIWQERFVEESNLTFNIGMLRKALGDDASKPTYIETVPRRGYRFIAAVHRVAGDSFQTNDDFLVQSPAELVTGEFHAETIGNSHQGTSKIGAVPTEISAARRPRRLFYLLLLAVLIGIGAASLFFLQQRTAFFTGKQAENSRQSQNLSVEKLTDTGNVNGVSISPDGRMLAYFTNEANKITIWLRQFATGKSIPIFTTDKDFVTVLTFSTDGEYIYYSHSDENQSPALSRLSILGGTPTKILNDVHGSFTFSPDGSQIVFADLKAEGTDLMIADSLGNNARRVFTIPKPGMVLSLDWSPDGKSIAYCLGNGKLNGDEAESLVMNLNLETKTETPLTDHQWHYIQNARWLPDGSGLLLTARRHAENIQQIWRLNIADGGLNQLTNSTSDLYLSDASADFSKIVATQGFLGTSISIAPKTDMSNVRMISKSHWEMAWTADSKIVFTAKDTARTTIWRVNADGSDKRQMTSDDTAVERSPAASADGRFIAFVSSKDGRKNIWRTDADGNNRVKVTDGEGESYPTFTPDGKFVVYNSNKDGSVWKVPVEGGTAMQILAEKAERVAISPDGTKLAHFGRRDGERKLFIKSFSDGKLLREFAEPSSNATPPKIVWTKDGQAIIFNDSEETLEVDNLRRQSLVGGTPQQLTNFNAEWIYDFGFSPDDRWLAIVRGSMNYDAVLLKGFE